MHQHTQTHTYTHTLQHAHRYTNMHTYTHARKHTYTLPQAHTHMHNHIHACKHTHTHTHTHTHLHTCPQTHIPPQAHALSTEDLFAAVVGGEAAALQGWNVICRVAATGHWGEDGGAAANKIEMRHNPIKGILGEPRGNGVGVVRYCRGPQGSARVRQVNKTLFTSSLTH